MKNPKTETDLSPFVIKYWKDLGYCVHGEVAIFKSSLFVDHVAHKGTCSCPTDVIAIEMKKGAGKSLQNQLYKLDRKHVAPTLYGVVFTRPNKKTLESWAELGMWNRPGLIYYHPKGEMEVLIEPKEVKPYTRKMNTPRLLLVEENRGVIAGYNSSDAELTYCTHRKTLKASVLDFLEHEEGKFSPEDLLDITPELNLYKNPKRTLWHLLKEIEESDRRIRHIGKDGKKHLFQRVEIEEDDMLDLRFIDDFEV